ncbi:MAG: hypothetical protein A2W23_01125 [Planctomycetes bacterium RBG_16_43_13]|nr:MAG: hypothetical protein A2W23_01125 [Planctomycetes bacterium RBG_16_43_13]
MAYYINADCIGCTICAKKCPVPCIWSNAVGQVAKPKEMHVIDPTLCIDCGVCATYCPVDCIQDETGIIRPKIEAKKRPVAIVHEDNCTGCEWCVDICPFNCLEMVEKESVDGEFFKIARDVRTKDCVACKLCEEVCVQKEAITIKWPDGEYCEEVGVPCTLENPNR